MQKRITQFVTENSRISARRFYDLSMNTEELVMDVGTVLNGQEAVDEGLIDSLGNLSEAIDCLYDMIDRDQAKASSKAKLASKSASKPAAKKSGKK